MPEAGAVNSGSAGAVDVSPRLEKTIPELRGLQELLLSGDALDSRILTDFREALNRIRNTAWSAQQYIALKATYHFFFQAEDGIRDLIVTGVQTCALPI